VGIKLMIYIRKCLSFNSWRFTTPYCTETFSSYLFLNDPLQIVSTRSSERDIRNVPACTVNRLILARESRSPGGTVLLESCECAWQGLLAHVLTSAGFSLWLLLGKEFCCFCKRQRS